MEKIIVGFNENPVEEIEKIDGEIQALPWSALLPEIGKFVRLRADEIIDGLIVTDTDVRVKISRKRGRKVIAKKPELLTQPLNVTNDNNL